MNKNVTDLLGGGGKHCTRQQNTRKASQNSKSARATKEGDMQAIFSVGRGVRYGMGMDACVHGRET